MRPTHLLRTAALAAVVACGGDGGSVTPPPVDNTPASITLSPNTPLTLASGASATITATVATKDGRPLSSSAVTWTSSDASIASVAGGTVTAAKVGTATITASSGSLTASVTATVTPGAAAVLALRTQPLGAATGNPLSAQPVVEIRDLAGNLVTTSTATVTASIASGGGALGGTTSVAAVAGVATFTNLSITGSGGDRTLAFSSPGLTGVTSGAVTITAPATSQLAIDNTAVAIAANFGANPASVRLNVTSSGAVSGLSVDSPTYDAGQPSAWLTVSLGATSTPTTITLTTTSSALAVGVYHAVFHVTSAAAANSPLTVGVTLTVSASATLTYGSATDRIEFVDIGTSYLPTTTASLAGGTGTTFQVTYTSRSPSVMSVGSDGRITGKAAGDGWVVASFGGASDSVFVTVPVSSTGPVLRATVTNYNYALGDTARVTIVLDTRSSVVGAGAFAINDATPWAILYSAPTTSPAPTVTYNAADAVWRAAVGSATGMTGVVPLLNLKITSRVAGAAYLYLNALDLSAVDGSSLTALTSSARIPLVFK